MKLSCIGESTGVSCPRSPVSLARASKAISPGECRNCVLITLHHAWSDLCRIPATPKPSIPLLSSPRLSKLTAYRGYKQIFVCSPTVSCVRTYADKLKHESRSGIIYFSYDNIREARGRIAMPSWHPFPHLYSRCSSGFHATEYAGAQ
jgi:hypothetical protein